MVTILPKSDSFPSTIRPSEQCDCDDALRGTGDIRLEWNGLAGCRVLRIIRRAAINTDTDNEDNESRLVGGDEELIGEICEPFS